MSWPFGPVRHWSGALQRTLRMISAVESKPVFAGRDAVLPRPATGVETTMTLRSTVSLVARRVPFIAAGYLGSCSAATFTGLFAVAMVNFVKGLAAGEVGQAIVMSIVIIMFGFIPAVISMVMMGVVPAALAVLVAELLRVRSVWIYAVAGALTGTAAYFTSWAADAPYGLGLWLPAVVPAGLVGGVVYWVIAVRLGGPPAAEKAAVPLPPHLNGPGGFPAQVPL